MPPSHPLASVLSDAEPRSFVVRVRFGAKGGKSRLLITVDDVAQGRKTHFQTLEAAFADIREALNPPDLAAGQSH
ncbi:MAG: hypothetical protein ACSHWS_07735 [Sulfitobacter sp.]